MAGGEIWSYEKKNRTNTTYKNQNKWLAWSQTKTNIILIKIINTYTAGEEARSDEEETWERVPLAGGEDEEVRAREDGFREGTGEGQGGHEEERTKVCFIRY